MYGLAAGLLENAAMIKQILEVQLVRRQGTLLPHSIAQNEDIVRKDHSTVCNRHGS